MSIIPITDREINTDPFPLDPFSSLTQFNPFPEFQFSSPLSNFYPESFAGGRVSGRIEWQESPTAYVVKGYLPGTTREKVMVEVEGDGRVLKISAEDGKFLTSFAVPDDALIDYLDASMGNGFLVVVVPKLAALAVEGPGGGPDVRSVQITEVSD